MDVFRNVQLISDSPLPWRQSRSNIRGASTASRYKTQEGRVASGQSKELLVLCHLILQWNYAQEISQLKEEITDISTEIDAMDTEEF